MVQAFLKKWWVSESLNGHRSDGNCKSDLPLSRHLRSTSHHDSVGKLKVTIIDHNPKWDDEIIQEKESFWIRKLKDLITEWNQWEKVISSLDSFFCWSLPVVLGHTVCSIGPKYISYTVVGRFLFNEFGYHTVFKKTIDSAIWYINQ